jgi:hypothetical protein
MRQKGDSKIIEEAKRRFRKCEEWEAEARAHYKDDMKFAEGDPDNGWQWNAGYADQRQRNGSPSLTLNKVREQNLQIVNDARQNKPQIRIQPVADGASRAAAKVFEGIVRHIEYISDAQTAYDTATYHQVYGGIGYIRLHCEVPQNDTTSFDQEIYIRRVADPLSVYLDPDIQRYDGSDANYAFIFENMKPDTFDEKYPKWKGKVGHDAIGGNDDWGNKENVRVAEYFRRSLKQTDTLMEVPPGLFPEMPNGGTIRRSELEPEAAQLLDTFELRTRPIIDPKVEWFKIAGSEIIERGEWAGSYIPIARVVGEETVIDGKLDRKGHTRSSKDAQRIYDYYFSAAVEQVALQSKTPWLVPLETIENYETYWENANLDNRPYLPYNAMKDGVALPKPERVQPPTMAPAFLQGLEMAANALMLTSGQYQAEMGAPSNERSGVAINARQRQADNATYHYVDHLAQGVRYLGRMIVDLAPKIYDTKRVMRIVGEDGSESHVILDPNAPQAHQEVDANDISEADVTAIFNPGVGTYQVVSDIGPAFATRRQEAFNAISQIMAHNPQFMSFAGDIMWKVSDFPYSDELEERFKQMLPPQIKDANGPPPEVQAMQAQMAQMHQAATATIQQAGQTVAQLKQQLADQQREHDRKDAELRLKFMQMQLDQKARDFDQYVKNYQAETARAATFGQIDPDGMKVIAREQESHVLGQPVMPIIAAHAKAEQDMQPEPEPTAPETVQ